MPVQLMRILAGCACLISTGWAELNWNQQRLAQVRLTANGSTDINAMLKNKLLTFTGRRGSMLQCQAKAGKQHTCIESTIHGLNGDRLIAYWTQCASRKGIRRRRIRDRQALHRKASCTGWSRLEYRL